MPCFIALTKVFISPNLMCSGGRRIVSGFTRDVLFRVVPDLWGTLLECGLRFV